MGGREERDEGRETREESEQREEEGLPEIGNRGREEGGGGGVREDDKEEKPGKEDQKDSEIRRKGERRKVCGETRGKESEKYRSWRLKMDRKEQKEEK